MITRRQFIQGLATTTAAVASRWPAFAVAGDAGSVPIIDTHQHLWDLSQFHLPWLRPGTVLHRSFLTEDYLQATQGLNIVKAVYMEVAVAPEQKLREAEYVTELCRRPDNPTVAAVIGGDPAGVGFAAYVRRFKDNHYIKGVRHIPAATAAAEFPYRQQDFVAGVQLLGELGMCFDLCVPPARLAEAIRLVDNCPATRFILDHCGNADPKAFPRAANHRQPGSARRPSHDPDQWRRAVSQLAQREHVVCKISGIIAQAEPEEPTAELLAPIVNHCLDAFGPERVMFASDWPVCTRVAPLRTWVMALQEIVASRSRAQQAKLFAQNAHGFFGLG